MSLRREVRHRAAPAELRIRGRLNSDGPGPDSPARAECRVSSVQGGNRIKGGGGIRAGCLQMPLAQGRSEGPARPRAGLGLQVHGQQVPPSKPCQTQQAHRSYSAVERRENAI